MNVSKISKIVDLYFALVKQAAQDVFAPKSIEEAKATLEISSSDTLTLELLNKKFKAAVLKHHPDKGGSDEMFKKVNAARYYLIQKLEGKDFNDPDTIESEIDEPEPSPHLTYEQIAQMRKEMGRDAFRQQFPDWETELKQEMGLEEFNRVFEGYDSKYDPANDPHTAGRYEQDLYETAGNLIADSIDTDALENRLDNLTKEEKSYLLKNLNDPDALLDAIDSLGLEQSSSLTLNKPSNTDAVIQENDIFNKLTEKQIRSLKRDIVTERFKNLIKYNSDSFSDVVSLSDLIQDRELIFLFDPGLHLKRSDVNNLITEDFKNYIKQDRIDYYQSWRKFNKDQYDWKNTKDQNKIFHQLAKLFISYQQSQGNIIPDTSWLGTDVFGGIARKFPEIYQELFDIANPANYIQS
jgi:hypothetical protein